jgi:phage terminase large subunit-like protein
MGQLQEDGFEVIEFPQTLKMFNEPTKSFEALVKAKRLHHGNHPVLTWMLSNVAIEQDGSGNYRPSKKKSTEKIDGVVSAIMALHSNMNAPPPQTSVYETRGLLYI